MVGAAPSFSEIHVVRTLLILGNKKAGRKALVQELGLGEGSVRTILKKLKREGFIVSDRLGHKLTEKGGNNVRRYLQRFSHPLQFKLKGIESLTGEGMHHCLIVVYNVAHTIRSGMEQRDTAFSAGASGALALVYSENRLRLPMQDVDLFDFSQVAEKLKDLTLKEGDVVVVSFGESYALAENGAVAIALDLI